MDASGSQQTSQLKSAAKTLDPYGPIVLAKRWHEHDNRGDWRKCPQATHLLARPDLEVDTKGFPFNCMKNTKEKELGDRGDREASTLP